MRLLETHGAAVRDPASVHEITTGGTKHGIIISAAHFRQDQGRHHADQYDDHHQFD
jgi:hypothetical protein